MTRKKNPVLEQIIQLDNQIEQGLIDGEILVQHTFDTTIDCANPLVAEESDDLLGLLTAIKSLGRIIEEEVSSGEDVTITDVLDALELIVNSYLVKRRNAIESYVHSRSVTEALLETANMERSGKKLH